METPVRFLSALALVSAAALPLSAQTAPVHHAAATTAPAAHRSACSVLPTLSPKIPALPADAPCAKALYTITRTPDTKLDYVSPLVSPEVRDTLGQSRSTFSLDYVDTKVGTGELIKSSKFLAVKYTGYLADGTKFDSSYDHPNGDPINFQYGMHRVIPGWDTGFEGMHVGGKRRLFIPYQLAYGEAGRPPVIPAKAELIFDIEIVGQTDTAPAPKGPPTPPGGLRRTPPMSMPPHPGTAPSGTGAAPATAPKSTTTPPASPSASPAPTTPPASTSAPKQ